MPFQKGNKLGKTFKPGQSGNPAGRKPSLYKSILAKFKIEEEETLSKSDAYKLIESLISLPETRLQEIGNDKELPTYLRIIANAIVKDLGSDSLRTTETIFNRVFGTPVSTNQLVGKDGKDLQLNGLTDEELDERIKKLRDNAK